MEITLEQDKRRCNTTTSTTRLRGYKEKLIRLIEIILCHVSLNTLAVKRSQR
jgi:hypothetical protein